MRVNDRGEGLILPGLRLLRTGEIISATNFGGTEVKLGHLPAENPLATPWALTQLPTTDQDHLPDLGPSSLPLLRPRSFSSSLLAPPPLIPSTGTCVAPWPASVMMCPLLLQSPKGNQPCALLTFPGHGERSDTLTLKNHTLMLLQCISTACSHTPYTLCQYATQNFPVRKIQLTPYAGRPNGPKLWESNGNL